MPTAVKDLRGMPAELAAKLSEHQITRADQLLQAGCSPQARKELVKMTGADPAMLLEMLNRADLDRIKGIGAAYSNLLEEAGVDTVKELARRQPANLLAKMLEINAAKKITSHPPTQAMIETWVTEAKTLPALLEY